MSELLVDFITSLEGCGAAEGWPGFWGVECPEYLEWLAESPEGDYTILMGATTYRLMHNFATEGSEEGVEDLTGARKVVFSSTLSAPLEWANSELVTGDAVEAVRAMKEDGVSMRTLGSVSLCRSLLAAGLVDRFRVVIFPFITGRTVRTGSTRATPTLRSTSSRAARSTTSCSCWSTPLASWTGHPPRSVAVDAIARPWINQCTSLQHRVTKAGSSNATS